MNSTANSTSQIPPNGIGAVSFTPLLAPNALFVTLFTILFTIQIILNIKFWRFYGYATGMLGGLLLEMLGYVAKVQLSHNRANKNGYIMYIIGLTLGPTFLSSSLYLGISTLQRHYKSARLARISPRLFASLFILGDFICLCFIGCGGSLAAIFDTNPIGVDLMIAGLATQVLFTAIFCLLLAIVCFKIHKQLAEDKKLAYIVELNGGFNGPLSSKEGLFIALDSIPMVLMSVLLTVIHPEFWFDNGRPLSGKVTEEGLEVHIKV
ncbi:hypothetical protein TGAM01_v203001 [Trichoderma gamsii]|uniref:RTA1 domain-containing protein n=1 Tax=Trichoderma gamsii TaxID=398673 RepID=A0A2P4ZU99_9HYPO|nr:hypothetical protein TGAM01_v203001 [Trichoderma gamsii]PON27864.1 hypothetical protein TGAM01_v203001 [Trichoderma gamsii]